MYQCLYTLMYQSVLLRCINECILGTYGTDLRQVSEERDRYFINHWVGAVGQMPRHKRLFKRSHLVLGRVGRLHRHGRDDQVDGVRPVLTRPRRRRFVRLWKLVRASGCVDLLNWMTSTFNKILHWTKPRFHFLCQNLIAPQCDQIGRFLKVLGNNFTCKSSPKRLLTFGLFWKRSSNVKTAVDFLG